MTKLRTVIPRLVVLFAVFAAACDGGEKTPASMGPVEPGREAVGYYCGMIVVDHPGPKAQIFVEGRVDPYWFTSVRDAVAFTLLPEEPKRITGIYVNDAATIGNWDRPDMNTWIGAKAAWYVIGSSRRGGMGAAEAVPFKEETGAVEFAREFGGEIVAFADIPQDYVLGDADGMPDDPVQSAENPTSPNKPIEHGHRP